jgi:hypothetical protein
MNYLFSYSKIMIDDIMVAMLTYIVNCMDQEGLTHGRFSLDNDSAHFEYSTNELKSALDKCKAMKLIQQITIGKNYNNLEITDQGVAIVRSKQQREYNLKIEHY